MDKIYDGNTKLLMKQLSMPLINFARQLAMVVTTTYKKLVHTHKHMQNAKQLYANCAMLKTI